MALSFIETSGDGVNQNFALSIQYLDKTHIHVFVGAVETLDFVWLNPALIQFNVAPPVGTNNVRIVRTTERAFPLVDYSNGSNLFDTDLDIGVLQNLFIAQEYYEQLVLPGGGGGLTPHLLDSHIDATVGESQVKGTFRVYANDGKTRALTATDGGILHGDAADFKGARFLPVGTTGQVLEVDTTLGGKLGWKQGLRNLLTAAGDLLVASATGVGARLGVGSNNAVLVADAAAALKMAWKTTLAGLTLTTPTISGGTLNGSFGGTYTLGGAPTISSPTITGGSITGATITGGSVSGATVSLGANSVGTGQLKTATGTVSGASNANLMVNMNDFSFFPQLFSSNGSSANTTNVGVSSGLITTPDNGTTVGRFGIGSNTSLNGFVHGARWRYITASDMPEIWVAYDPITGEIKATWASDDPPGNPLPGVEVDGCTSIRLTSRDLEHLSILNNSAEQAAALIRDTGRRMQHQAYRALQLHAQDDAPSLWILGNCTINPGGQLRMK